jgi:hypothetical protein
MWRYYYVPLNRFRVNSVRKKPGYCDTFKHSSEECVNCIETYCVKCRDVYCEDECNDRDNCDDCDIRDEMNCYWCENNGRLADELKCNECDDAKEFCNECTDTKDCVIGRVASKMMHTEPEHNKTNEMRPTSPGVQFCYVCPSKDMCFELLRKIQAGEITNAEYIESIMKLLDDLPFSQVCLIRNSEP